LLRQKQGTFETVRSLTLIKSIPKMCGQVAPSLARCAVPRRVRLQRVRNRYHSRLDRTLYKFLEATVADHMTRSVKCVSRELTLRELEDLFERDDYNAYPVEEDSRVIGLVTKYDFLKCFAFHPTQMLPHYDDVMKRTIGDIMAPEFIYVHADTKLTRVLQLMVDHQTRSIPVIDADRKLVGIISREDIIRALASFTKLPV
jgi:CBS domain-containing protein